jgi:ABC-type amino acid transport substrate-binding protein
VFVRGSKLLATVLTAAALVLTGCGITVPSDPSGTLDAVRGGTLRAGISPNGDFVDVAGPEPTGSEVDAIEAFAKSLDAQVSWTVGSEESLVRGLEEKRLDLVAGGMTDQTPWVAQAAVTRPYTEITDESGATRKLVMLVPIGENAFLSELEVFLVEHAESAP